VPKPSTLLELLGRELMARGELVEVGAVTRGVAL
jgi:hypothetical protein